MTTTLARADIVEALIQEVGFTRTQAIQILEATLDTLISSLVLGELVKISSFGSFSVRHKAKRVGRNPKTKEEVMIGARRTLSFKPSQCLKGNVQQYRPKKSKAVA